MSKSPGHQQWPDHKVRETALGERMTVRVGDTVLADSRNVIRVDEDEQPPRFYFPRSDVKTQLLERSDTTTECPFKGTARYFNVHAGGQTLEDGAWSYEAPYEEHRALKERLAFYEEKMAGMQIRPG